MPGAAEAVAHHLREAESIARQQGARGFEVRAVEVSEFAKAEGGMTCLSLLFRQP